MNSKNHLALGASLLVSVATAQRQAPFTEGLVIAPDTTRIESLVDVDGDGIEDAVGWFFVNSNYESLRCSVHLFDGEGQVRRTVETETPTFSQSPGNRFARGSAVGDFDGDSRPEQVVFLQDKFVRMEFDVNGDITFLPMSIHPSPTTEFFGGAYRQLKVIDFDQDGMDDLIMVGRKGIELFTAKNGLFEMVDELAWPVPAYTTLDLGEFDGAPGVDLAISFNLQLTDAIGIYTFSGGVIQEYAYVPVVGPTGSIHLMGGDIDGDSDDDLLIFGYTRHTLPPYDWTWALHTFHQTSPGSFTEAPVGMDMGPATDLADIDGDGDLDGICCGGGGTQTFVNDEPSIFEVSINSGDGVFTRAQPFPGLGAEHIGGATDFDGDGDLDLVAGRAVLLNTSVAGALECAGSPTSLGVPAVLHAIGTASIGTGNLELFTRNLPPFQFGLSIFGTDRQSLPLFDGALCVGGQIFRLPIQQANGSGQMQVALDFNYAPAAALLPGDVIHVQTWFRDPGAATGANLSNSGRILLMP